MTGEPRRVKPIRRATLIGVCLVVLVLVVGMEVRGNDGTARPPEPTISAGSPEARLAGLEPAPTPAAGVRAVKRLSTFLDTLEAECPANSRRELAALAYRGVEQLRAHGFTAVRPTDVFNGVMAQEDIGSTARCGRYFQRSVAKLATEQR
jgi:hypothetical protein